MVKPVNLGSQSCPPYQFGGYLHEFISIFLNMSLFRSIE